MDATVARRLPCGSHLHRRERTLGDQTPRCGRRLSKSMAAGRLSMWRRMSGQNLIYCFACPGCGESIQLPRQSSLGSVGPSQFQCTSVWPILFLCSRFASINTVSPSDVHLATDLVVDRTRHLNSLWTIDGDCRLENCGKRHSLYTYSLSDADPHSILHTFLSTKPLISCLGGHPARFHRDYLTISRVLMS